MPNPKQEIKVNEEAMVLDLVDPQAIARRRIHKLAAQWMVNYGTKLHLAILVLGFFIFILPLFWNGQLFGIINIAPLLSAIFRMFYRLTGWLTYGICLLISLTIIRQLIKIILLKSDQKNMTYKEIINMEKFPKYLKHEIYFWISIIHRLIAEIILIILPFAIFLRLITIS